MKKENGLKKLRRRHGNPRVSKDPARVSIAMAAKSEALTLTILPDRFAVCRLDKETTIPQWAFSGPFVNVTKTDNELSIVCLEAKVPAGIQVQAGWRCLMVSGPLDFSLVGILSSILNPLTRAGVSVFAISTFDTDYVLVQGEQLNTTVSALVAAGHHVI